MTNSSATRPRWGRRAFSALTASALLFGLSAMPAAADPVTGEYNGTNDPGQRITMGGGSIQTNLFHLELHDGNVLRMYCIDYETSIQRVEYIEGEWSEYDGRGDFEAEAGKVHWILQNSFPQVEVDVLADRSDAEGLTQAEAITGTQAAIWHYSNGKDLDPQDDQANVAAVYDYLVREAKDLPQSNGDEPTFSIDPEAAEGVAGEIVGEFEVSTSGTGVPLDLDAPDGVELVNLDGTEISTVDDGDTFGVLVPEDAEPGEATVSGTVSESTEVGRLFKGLDEKVDTQVLITAEGESLTDSDEVTVSWDEAPEDEEPPPPDDKDEPEPTPTPTPEPTDEPTPPDDKETPPADEEDEGKKPEEGGLPVTGSTLTGLIIAALVALGGGGLALYLARKRRTGLPAEG